MNKILRIDLSKGRVSEEEISEDIRRNFVGGRGLGVKIIFDEVDPEIDPLSDENKLVMATGPLTGTAAPTSGRYSMISKSPLTGTICDSNSGGYFGHMLKATGYDAMIIEGKSNDPVYLWFHDQEMEIRDAGFVWGKDVDETTEKILKDTDPKAKISCIGQAGELKVRLACVINDKHRALGRGGLGAILGIKKSEGHCSTRQS